MSLLKQQGLQLHKKSKNQVGEGKAKKNNGEEGQRGREVCVCVEVDEGMEEGKKRVWERGGERVVKG